ncbi:peptidylprolyl isomerase [Ectothiorhodospira haloalkaliphila]|uniref:peptidylprolyl isomerase n=1 Tax=Ectothiorhodospira haloalkaliphila TaxID=421628 RepID=UPI001EE8A823|nr:peptidylprolyl isomerase [Ectothiorhodospira haloalkaliphila]MCG5525764.1 peptidylprolyl isomerase [Ectothiorhodospira haloalkaliphila]
MKTIINILLAGLMAAGSAALAQDGRNHPGVVPLDEDGRLLDRIVAVAEEDVIMHSELFERIQTIQRQLAARDDGQAPPVNALVRPVLDRLVLERLQLQEARRIGIRIDDISLNNAIENIARENGMTLTQFRDRLVADGIDFRAFREQIRDEMAIAQLHRRQVDSRIQVSEQEIDDLIASESGAIDRDVEYRLLHLLVSLPEGATPEQIRETRQRAERIREEAAEGADFTELALRESQGQQALEGGDLGWRNANQVPTLFSRHVVLMREGEVSEVIRSPSGFHIVKLADRRAGSRSLVQQTRVRHILISPSEVVSDQEAHDRIRSLRNRIEDGADFGELARAHSDDRGSALRGGDLGWTDPGDMVPQFEQVMRQAEPGSVSEPFRTRFGWHILQVEDRRSHDSSRELMRSQAREIIRDRKRDDELEVWLRRLRDESYVEVRLGNVAAADPGLNRQAR